MTDPVDILVGLVDHCPYCGSGYHDKCLTEDGAWKRAAAMVGTEIAECTWFDTRPLNFHRVRVLAKAESIRFGIPEDSILTRPAFHDLLTRLGSEHVEGSP